MLTNFLIATSTMLPILNFLLHCAMLAVLVNILRMMKQHK